MLCKCHIDTVVFPGEEGLSVEEREVRRLERRKELLASEYRREMVRKEGRGKKGRVGFSRFGGGS